MVDPLRRQQALLQTRVVDVSPWVSVAAISNITEFYSSGVFSSYLRDIDEEV